MQIIKIFNCYGIISCVPNDKVTGGKALKLSDPDMINQNAYQHRVNRIPCYLFFFCELAYQVISNIKKRRHCIISKPNINSRG
jgi:hypothetical protein